MPLLPPVKPTTTIVEAVERFETVERVLFCVDYAAEAQGAGAVFGWGHQQVFTVLGVAVGAGEIPEGVLRLIVAATS
jgi:hypothetical protein